MESNDYYEINKCKYLTLIGHVQSGKTNEEINYCYQSINYHKLPVIFIVRNIKADQMQLRYRFKDSGLKVHLLSLLDNPSAIKVLENTGIIILLCNSIQLEKIKEVLIGYKGEYNLCIDEVDFSIKSKGYASIIDRIFLQLKQGATHILGATATPFALFSNEPMLTKIKKITPHRKYHGIDTLKINYVEPNIISTNVVSDTHAINEIYDSLLKKDSAMILHNVNKKKKFQKNLSQFVSALFPQFTVVVYNGDGVKVICPNRPDKPMTKRKTVNNYNQLINKYQFYDNVHCFENYSISEVLQLLVDDPIHKHCFISIISGHLASRGISFVSSDYSLHLTDQYFHTNPKTHGENLLQSLRILGCYSDTNPLTLWCSKKIWKSIKQQNKIINDIVSGIDNEHEYLTKIKEIIIKKPICPFTRPKLSRGTIFNTLGNKKCTIDFQMEEETI